MIEIQNNKILLAGKELQFDHKIIEAAEYEGKVVIVFETDEDGGYDNVFCYTQDLQLLWINNHTINKFILLPLRNTN